MAIIMIRGIAYIWTAGPGIGVILTSGNKIVSRFYITRRCRSEGERLTFLSLQQAEGYFGMFTSALMGFGTALSLKTIF